LFCFLADANLIEESKLPKAKHENTKHLSTKKEKGKSRAKITPYQKL
jgi:hypothetical protein